MAGFNLAEMLSSAGVNLDTGREQIEYISIDLIVPDPNNFYELSDLDSLASNIALCGLQQPLRVRRMEGDESQVIILSGHRRHAALKMLIAEGREDLADVPCIVEEKPENPKLTQLKLIYANASTRVISSAEQAKQAEQVEQLLYELKEEGMEFPGRMRDHVAQACQVSTGKLARLKLIRSNLIPHFMKLWESGRLPDNAAEVLARETPSYQKMIFLAQTSEMTKSFKCYASWLESLIHEMHRVEKICKETTCEKNFTTGCDHVHTRLNHAAGLAQYIGMSCRGCCCTCYSLQTCKYSCEYAAKEKVALKDKAKQQKQHEAREKAEKERQEVQIVEDSNSRVFQMLEDKGISTSDYIKKSMGYACPHNVDRMEKMKAGAKATANERMPGGICPHEAIRLCETADFLGCSVDYLLGRDIAEEKPEPQTIQSGWQQGTPTARGYYVVAYRRQPGGPMFYRNAFWSTKKWEQLDSLIEVLYWMPVPEEA